MYSVSASPCGRRQALGRPREREVPDRGDVVERERDVAERRVAEAEVVGGAVLDPADERVARSRARSGSPRPGSPGRLPRLEPDDAAGCDLHRPARALATTSSRPCAIPANDPRVVVPSVIVSTICALRWLLRSRGGATASDASQSTRACVTNSINGRPGLGSCQRGSSAARSTRDPCQSDRPFARLRAVRTRREMRPSNCYPDDAVARGAGALLTAFACVERVWSSRNGETTLLRHRRPRGAEERRRRSSRARSRARSAPAAATR